MSKSRPSSVMDAPPSFEERIAFEKAQAENQRFYDEDALFDATSAAVKNEGRPNSPLFGSDPDDAKSRRQSRGMFAKEDHEPAPEDWFDRYNGPRSGDQVRTMEDLSAYVGYQMALARELRPYDFDEVIFDHVIPMLREVGLDENDPNVQKWILTSDFCEDAYRKGLEIKNQNKLPEGWEKWDGDRFGEWLSSNHGSARRVSEDPPKPDSRREMKRMIQLENPEDFVRELEALKAKW